MGAAWTCQCGTEYSRAFAGPCASCLAMRPRRQCAGIDCQRSAAPLREFCSKACQDERYCESFA